jgi:hypothetical protein
LNPAFVFRRIDHPDGSLRVEFRRHNNGDWTYQPAEGGLRFESYAAALVHAHRVYTWIPSAVVQHSWHVELLRGHIFQVAEYSEPDIHDHCVACAKKFMSNWPGEPVTGIGYRTRYEIPDGAKRWQADWLCVDCFHELQGPLQWVTEDAIK